MLFQNYPNIVYNHYRLGDVVKDKSHRNCIEGRELYYKLYPNSIATKYMKSTDEDKNYKLLTSIVKEYKPTLKPNENELVIHIRVGDIIDDTPYSVNQFLEKEIRWSGSLGGQPQDGGKENYVKPLSYYERVVEEYKKTDIRKVVLVCGGCKGRFYVKSKEYIVRIKDFFESNNYKVNVRFGETPDDDFVYMCRSKYFISGGGGFTTIVKDINSLIM